MKREKQNMQRKRFQVFPKYLLDTYCMPHVVLVFVIDKKVYIGPLCTQKSLISSQTLAGNYDS